MLAGGLERTQIGLRRLTEWPFAVGGGVRERTPGALGRDALLERGGHDRDLRREGAGARSSVSASTARLSSPTTARPTARQAIATGTRRSRRSRRSTGLRQRADGRHRGRPWAVGDHGRCRRQLRLRRPRAVRPSSARGLRPRQRKPVQGRHSGGRDAVAAPVVRQPGARRFVGRRLYGTPCGDIYCGLRGFDREKVAALDIRSSGMEFAIEMIVKATMMGLRVTEVPTTLSPDAEGREPHLNTWRDGWRSIRLLLLYSPEVAVSVPRASCCSRLASQAWPGSYPVSARSAASRST